MEIKTLNRQIWLCKKWRATSKKPLSSESRSPQYKPKPETLLSWAVPRGEAALCWDCRAVGWDCLGKGAGAQYWGKGWWPAGGQCQQSLRNVVLSLQLALPGAGAVYAVGRRCCSLIHFVGIVEMRKRLPASQSGVRSHLFCLWHLGIINE